MVKVCQLVIAQVYASACFGGNRQCVNAFETCQRHVPTVLMKSHFRHTRFTPYKVTKKIKTASIILK